MQTETKFLRLHTPVTIGSRFDDWVVTWLGGWTRDRLSYIVMVVKIDSPAAATARGKRTRTPRQKWLGYLTIMML